MDGTKMAVFDNPSLLTKELKLSHYPFLRCPIWWKLLFNRKRVTLFCSLSSDESHCSIGKGLPFSAAFYL